jgi:putative salt-induced outer membrane protein YdiY
MNHTKRLNRIFGRLACGLLALSLATAPAWADVIETKNGARLVGKVVKVDGAAVSLETDYAGVISVKLSEVTSVRTEAPLIYRLAGGTVLQGTLASTDGGQVRISGTEGAVTTPLDKIAATWAPGAPDPAVVAMQRAWTYEAAMDLTGKSGNRDQTGTAASFRAVLAGPQDTLQFYAAYDRQETDGQKSADQFRAGVDYQNNFSGRRSWYVRNEGGFDRIKDVDLYNVAAAGLGLDFIKEAKQTLTGRAGVSFRYEGYKNPRTEDVRSAGLDFGLNHRLEMETSVLVNRLSFVPAFEDFGNYRAIHESFLELPTANPRWKLRIGLLNDYNSEPGAGVEEMDTTYFARLVLNWK